MNARGVLAGMGPLQTGLATIGLFLGVVLAPGSTLAQRYVPGEHPDFPNIKYSDSLVSVNDRCIVKQTKLNLKVRPVYVNWRPIGFC